MVEQPHSSKGHNHVVLVAFFDDQVIPNGTAGLGHVAHTGLEGPLDVVREGEEGIRAQGDVLPGGQELPLLFLGQGLRTLGKVVLPNALGADVLFVAVDIAVNYIVPVGPAQVRLEGQGQGLGMLPQEPGVGFGACQTGAVNPDCCPAPTPMAWPS